MSGPLGLQGDKKIAWTVGLILINQKQMMMWCSLLMMATNMAGLPKTGGDLLGWAALSL
jgi:hypothetical protein